VGLRWSPAKSLRSINSSMPVPSRAGPMFAQGGYGSKAVFRSYEDNESQADSCHFSTISHNLNSWPWGSFVNLEDVSHKYQLRLQTVWEEFSNLVAGLNGTHRASIKGCVKALFRGISAQNKTYSHLMLRLRPARAAWKWQKACCRRRRSAKLAQQVHQPLRIIFPKILKPCCKQK